MNVALVILHADPARGGAERYTVDLAEALAARGHDVSVLASSFPGEMPGVRQVTLPARAATRLGRYRRFLDALDGHLGGRSYDVVHAMLPVRRCDLYHPHAGIAAEAVATGHLKYNSAAAQLASKVANRINVKRRAFAAVERELLTGPEAPVVLCLSEYVKRNTRKHYPRLDDARLATLFNAIDLEKFDPAKRPAARDEVRRRFGVADDHVVALMMAQDYLRKGLREAIGAVAAAGDARLRLVVVGKQDPAAYRRLAQQQGVGGQVVFAGRTDDPYAFYRAADCFVLPTRHDPCSLATLEALAMGVPVVSTAYNGACEVMQDGRHGFVLPDPADVPALAGALRRLLDDDARRAMAHACLALRPTLAYGRHVDELLRVYEAARARRATGRV